jgi:hypothetical protein
MAEQLLFDFDEADLAEHTKKVTEYLRSFPPPPEKPEPVPEDTLALLSWKPLFDEKTAAYDYTSYPANKLLLADPYTILERDPPPWLPPVSRETMQDYSFLPVFQFDENNTFRITPPYDFRSDQTVHYRVTLEQFAGLVDYHVKYERAKEKERLLGDKKSLIEYYKKKAAALKALSIPDLKTRKTIDLLEKRAEGNFMIKARRVALMPYNKMNLVQMDAFKKNNLSPKEFWNRYYGFREQLRQKLSDMLCQREDYESSYSKGQCTSYGAANTSDRLLDEYGVLVKRQNGNAITDGEIRQVKAALEKFYALMGNFSPLARDYRLKISHAGEKKIFASRFSGIFTPFHHAIGVSFKNQESAPIILAHELAHFLDSRAGDPTGHFYASDDASSPEYAVAITFRSLMNKNQEIIDSKYYNRTCECFARAIEQYTALHAIPEYFKRLSLTPAYMSQENFTKDIIPLIGRYVMTRQSLLHPHAVPSVAAAQKGISLPVIPETTRRTPPRLFQKPKKQTLSRER